MVDHIAARETELLESMEIMRTYLLLKLRESDFHGIADAAMDMRDIDAELKGLRLLKG